MGHGDGVRKDGRVWTMKRGLYFASFFNIFNCIDVSTVLGMPRV